MSFMVLIFWWSFKADITHRSPLVFTCSLFKFPYESKKGTLLPDLRELQNHIFCWSDWYGLQLPSAYYFNSVNSWLRFFSSHTKILIHSTSFKSHSTDFVWWLSHRSRGWTVARMAEADPHLCPKWSLCLDLGLDQILSANYKEESDLFWVRHPAGMPVLLLSAKR